MKNTGKSKHLEVRVKMRSYCSISKKQRTSYFNQSVFDTYIEKFNFLVHAQKPVWGCACSTWYGESQLTVLQQSKLPAASVTEAEIFYSAATLPRSSATFAPVLVSCVSLGEWEDNDQSSAMWGDASVTLSGLWGSCLTGKSDSFSSAQLFSDFRHDPTVEEWLLLLSSLLLSEAKINMKLNAGLSAVIPIKY